MKNFNKCQEEKNPMAAAHITIRNSHLLSVITQSSLGIFT
jgi:hypothetical protein